MAVIDRKRDRGRRVAIADRLNRSNTRCLELAWGFGQGAVEAKRLMGEMLAHTIPYDTLLGLPVNSVGLLADERQK